MGALEQLVITLREGMEAALIVAIALAYLRKIGRRDLEGTVYQALGAAVALSVAGAIGLTLWQWNEDRIEGWLMLVGGVFVATMVYWMNRHAKMLRGEIESRLAQLHEGGRWGLFLFVFFMVLREGMETVLMLSAVRLDSSELLAWLGSVAGLLLAIGFAVAFLRGSLRAHVPRFFRITTWMLVVIAVQLFLTGLHELAEAGVLPASRQEMHWVGPIVRNDVFFFVVILGLAGVLLLRERNTAAAAAAGGDGAAGATARKQRAEARTARLWSTLGYSAAFAFIVILSADYAYSRTVSNLSAAEELVASHGIVTVPVSEAGDGQLHRYAVGTPAGVVRFFAIRRPDGSIAVAFDACQICGGQGYYRMQGQLLCKNCNAPINIASVGDYGGCNPIPLKFEQQGSVIAIPVSALSEEAPAFAGR